MKNKSLIFSLMLAVMLSTAFSAEAYTGRLGAERMSFNPTNIVTKTSDYTVTTSDSLINCTTSGADLTFTLPTVAAAKAAGGLVLKLYKTDSNDYDCIFSPATGDTVGGESARYVVSQYGYAVISSGPGNDWTVDYESSYVTEDHEAGTVDFTGLASTAIAGDTTISGTTPTLTVGDAGEEDAAVIFDGAAQDYYVGLDDTSDDLVLGLGSALGTTIGLGIDENLAVTMYGDLTVGGTTPVVTIGDAGAEDTVLDFDGAAQDFYIGLDDTDDDLNFGLGSTPGTTTAFSIDEDQTTTFTGGLIGPSETTTATDVLTASQCGNTIFLNSATEYATTLPAVSTVTSGCSFEFVVKAAAAAADYTILTGNSLENLIYGSMEVAGAVVACAAEDTITLVDGNAIGDSVRVVSDGAAWYISGSTVTTAKATCTQAD